MHPLFAVWTHDLSPFLLRFPEGFPVAGIRYYGLAYILGFLAAAWLLHRYYRKQRSPWNPDQIWTLMTALVVGVMVGGRVGYLLLYRTGTLVQDPLALFRVWEGGMASHGGMVGIALALLWFARHTQTPFLAAADRVVTVGPIGVCFGRIANFINGELWGRPTDAPWGVVFPDSPPVYNPETLQAEVVARHPSQLYQAGLEGLLLFAWLQWRLWKTPALARPGQLTGEFLVGYSCLRIVGEVFREPDAGLILGLSRGTAYSLLMGVAGVALLVAVRRLANPRA
ncbi:MAG: prolipoprotein diacylglyceryl transferase [Opitutales bacterium]